MANLPNLPGAKPKTYASTVHGSGRSIDFWDFVAKDPQGNSFAPGYSGQTFLTNNAWNYIQIGKSAYTSDVVSGKQPPPASQFVLSPGKVDISVNKQCAHDGQNPLAANGTTQVPQGVRAPDFDMKFTIWTQQQWQAFQAFIFDYVPTPKRNPKSYTIIHPALQIHNIHAVTIWGLDGPYDGPVARSKVFVMKCSEFVPKSDETEVPALDDNVYAPYYASSPSSTMQSTPGNTTPPEQPAGIN